MSKLLLNEHHDEYDHHEGNQKNEQHILPLRRTLRALEGAVPHVVGLALGAEDSLVACLASS